MRFLQETKSAGKVRLDAANRKILYELAVNARSPSSSIAKRIGLSRDAVSYRIGQLEKKGVIQGYRTVIDIAKLGFMSVHVFLQLNQPTAEAEEKLIRTFQEYRFVRAIIKFSGKYDFELAVGARTLEELDVYITTVIHDCGVYLQRYELFFVTGCFVANVFPESFAGKRTLQWAGQKNPASPRLDKSDLIILKTIADNARLPLYKIAGQAGLSADAARYRLKKLKECGIIQRFVPALNYDAISHNVYAILLNIHNLDQKKEAMLREFLRTNRDLLWGVKAIGKYNVLLYICTQEPGDLIKTTTALKRQFSESIREYETLINYEEYKYSYFLDIIEK